MELDRNLKILGTGRYVPANIIYSEELDKKMGFPVGTSFKTTGVKTRYWVNGESATDMALEASNMALERAGLKKTDLDLIVSSHGVPEQLIPPQFSLISKKLGLKTSRGFDVNSSCMGFLQALDIVSYLISNGKYSTALICSSDITSNGLNYKDVECALFGDGAASAIVGKSEDGNSGIFSSYFETYPEGSHLSEVKSGGSKSLGTNYTPEDHDDYLYKLQGSKMAKFIFSKFDGFFENVKKETSSTLEEVLQRVTAIIPHQVNYNFLKALRRKLKMPEEKFINISSDYGNMFSVSLPLCLDHVIHDRNLKRGNELLFLGGASGISLGFMHMRY